MTKNKHSGHFAFTIEGDVVFNLIADGEWHCRIIFQILGLLDKALHGDCFEGLLSLSFA